MMAPQVGVPKDVIAASQQRGAGLLYREKVIPRPVTIAGHVWTWKRKGQ